jgi:hypothetical protein
MAAERAAAPQGSRQQRAAGRGHRDLAFSLRRARSDRTGALQWNGPHPAACARCPMDGRHVTAFVRALCRAEHVTSPFKAALRLAARVST